MRSLFSSFLFVLFLTATTAVYAQLVPASGALGPVALSSCNFATGDLHFHCIPLYVGYLVKVLLGFAGGFFIFGMILAGYKYMFGSITAQGTEAGKKEIIARVIGLAVIVLSYLLVDGIIQILT